MYTTLLTTLLVAAALGFEDLLPTFEWNDDPGNNGNIQLNIDFHDGGQSDVAILERIHSHFGNDEDDEVTNECMLTGYLRDEPSVPIRVLGCPGHHTFQVIFNSQRVVESTFMVHNGQVKAFHLDPNQESSDDDESVEIERVNAPDRILDVEERYISDRNLPTAFTVTMSIKYDSLFLYDVCGGDHDLAKSRVEKIVSLAQAYYLDSNTLGTKVYLSIQAIGHVDAELRLREGGWCDKSCILRNAIDKLSANDPLDVDHYHYISADNPTGPDTSGIARRWGYWGEEHSGSICWPAKKERTAITEFWGNPKDWEGGKLNAAIVFTHELGHSLGMSHDHLTSKHDPRKDASGNSCLNVNGIMSYKDVRTTWSTCSKEDIRGWFDQLSRFGVNCKEDEEPPVDCAWGEWSEYSSCSVSCDGDGIRTRQRTKAVEAANGGFDCAGPTEETANCNNGPCAVNGQWGSWGQWGECTKSCGTGTRIRVRECNNPAPSGGGKFCPGRAEETDKNLCNTDECPGNSDCVDMNPTFCNSYKGQYWFGQWCFINLAHDFFSGYTLMQYCEKSCGGCR